MWSQLHKVSGIGMFIETEQIGYWESGEGGHKGLLCTGCRVSVWDNEKSSALSNTIHKNKLKMDKRSECKTRNYKTPRGEHRQNTLRHKSQQDPL